VIVLGSTLIACSNSRHRWLNVSQLPFQRFLSRLLLRHDAPFP
jgi:hypothetical protein